MPRVAFIEVCDGFDSYDSYNFEGVVQYITEWKEISDEEYYELINIKHYLPRGVHLVTALDYEKIKSKTFESYQNHIKSEIEREERIKKERAEKSAKKKEQDKTKKLKQLEKLKRELFPEGEENGS